MKAKVVLNQNATFKPITIEFLIESKEDLANLWHRFNVPTSIVNDNSNYVSSDWRASFVGEAAWEPVDELARVMGFIPS